MYTLYILYLNTLGMRHKQGDQKLFRKLKNDRFKLKEMIDRFVLAVTLFPKFFYYVMIFIRFV